MTPAVADDGMPRIVDCAVGTAPCLEADDDAGYEIDEAEVIYWGQCPECRTAGPAHRTTTAP
jgi:Fur family ferric uptake transcriptional regulator